MSDPSPKNPAPADDVIRGAGAVLIRPALHGAFPGLIAAVSTRIHGVSGDHLGLNTSFRVGDDEDRVRANRRLFFTAAGVTEDRLATAGQVHGAVVSIARRPGHYEKCDALITSEPGLYLAISVADCLPIILVDPPNRSVGLVHSGWKGSGGKVVQRALEAMAGCFGTEASQVHAYIGPSAGGCCYEVGEEVASIFPEDVLRAGTGDGPRRLDLIAFNRGVLLRAGVPEKHLHLSTHCTIHEKDLFHSYRRDGARSGRMMAIVGFDENGVKRGESPQGG